MSSLSRFANAWSIPEARTFGSGVAINGPGQRKARCQRAGLLITKKHLSVCRFLHRFLLNLSKLQLFTTVHSTHETLHAWIPAPRSRRRSNAGVGAPSWLERNECLLHSGGAFIT